MWPQLLSMFANGVWSTNMIHNFSFRWLIVGFWKHQEMPWYPTHPQVWSRMCCITVSGITQCPNQQGLSFEFPMRNEFQSLCTFLRHIRNSNRMDARNIQTFYSRKDGINKYQSKKRGEEFPDWVFPGRIKHTGVKYPRITRYISAVQFYFWVVSLLKFFEGK